MKLKPSLHNLLKLGARKGALILVRVFLCQSCDLENVTPSWLSPRCFFLLSCVKWYCRQQVPVLTFSPS